MVILVGNGQSEWLIDAPRVQVSKAERQGQRTGRVLDHRRHDDPGAPATCSFGPRAPRMLSRAPESDRHCYAGGARSSVGLA